MSLHLSSLVALALVVLMFAVAAIVERQGAKRANARLRLSAYTLALGVYCTSWTFYGAVGSAVRDGWSYLPIYAAPILLLLVAPRFLRRLADAVAEERATTVSDFIAARFGHDIVVARLVTTIALLGTIPYIALQLRSIGAALSIVSGADVSVPAMLVAAPLLAIFAALFGARRFELAGRSEGLLYAIALESVIKLLALVLVAGIAIMVIANADAAALQGGLERFQHSFRADRMSLEVAIIFLIAMPAIIVLPRQFYMGLVEARQPGDFVRARFGLAAYLGLMAVVILPIALAGTMLLDPSVSPDVYVLELPAAREQGLVLAAALLGGVSAAASMAIVDSTALATMVSNDLLFPTLVRRRVLASAGTSGAMGQRMLRLRRATILVIMLLGLAWALLVSSQDTLASIGLIAFAAMAQFVPHLILAATGKNRDALAARASLCAGLIFWLYTLALPPVLPESFIAALKGTLIDPTNLLGIGSATPLTHGVIWSVGANLAVFGAIAARGLKTPQLPRMFGGERLISNQRDLVQLTGSFVGREEAERAFSGVDPAAPVDRRSARRARTLIAQVVGSSSARALVASALAGGKLSVHDVARLLDEGGASLQFSRKLLASTFENIDAGISVVDADLNLVAWNSRYLDLFDYPPDMVYVGAPVAALIRHNARHGDFGPGDVEMHVRKRLDHLRNGQPHHFERQRHDGKTIKTVGGPMPGGGYVMSFTDISEEARMRAALRTTLNELEHRVEQRTMELRDANQRLAAADRDKTRFLAAASHDLLQPLHAARLFTNALSRDATPGQTGLLSQVEQSLLAAEDLLRSLLDISRLDAGGVTPEPVRIPLRPFLSELSESFRPTALGKGLSLRAVNLRGTVQCDVGLLRSVLQNILSNAVRYTERGGVLIGVRRRGACWRIDIIDTGVGIPPDQVSQIFAEFTRLGTVEAEGLGLGLALVRRIVPLIGGQLDVRSRPGRGSCFSLTLPAHDDVPLPPPIVTEPRLAHRSLSVLVVDDDPRIVAATIALLEALGHRGIGVGTTRDALAAVDGIDAALVDYRLGAEQSGLALIAKLRARRPELATLLVTAERGAEVRVRARALGVDVVAKPANPAAIEAFLSRASVPQIDPE
ncbi:response regulator [Sphingomonas suaedae]|uniref:histidine kinase n=1 Tax=Sphingomonas suaedae TaxID=2599297 RepID=A0A518RCF9_9SPHN|nr:PAS-domain containing protein [Sphingomonas suaedae]QDX25147.1 response regulator [Sphingomonas suaedae]